MFKKGTSGNPNGRPKGVPNKTVEDIKRTFATLLEHKLPEIEDWLNKIAEKNPDKAVELLIKISERFVPKLNKSEITGADGEDLFSGLKFNFNKPFKNAEDDNEDI